MYHKIEFEKVKDIVTKGFALECCTMSEKFTASRRFLSGGFFCLTILFFNLFANYIKNNFQTGTIPLDSQNEYRYLVFPLTIWALLTFILFLWLFVSGSIFRNKNNMKLSYLSMLWLLFFSVVCYLSAFICAQLLIESSYLRYFYTFFFLTTTFFSILKSKEESSSMLIPNKNPRELTTYIMNHRKKISTIITIFWVLLIIYNLLFGNINFSEGIRRTFYLMFLSILPIIISLISFFWVTIKKYYYRMYYLNKYSEQYRKYFEIDLAIWYGSKSKEYKEEQEKGRNNA